LASCIHAETLDKHIILVVIYRYIHHRKNLERRAIVSFMECLKCDNCKTDSAAYFCLMRNDFVLNQDAKSLVVEKSRSGWKKGDPNYEVHRRKTRKEVEV